MSSQQSARLSDSPAVDHRAGRASASHRAGPREAHSKAHADDFLKTPEEKNLSIWLILSK